MKLNQIIALVAGKKTRIQKALTAVHHGWKSDQLSGISRVYTPKDEEGDELPPESRPVQLNVTQVIKKIQPPLANFMNIVATQERANTNAEADIVIQGKMIAKEVPVTVLLFLEKQLVDIRTFIEHLPTLPQDKQWEYDKNRNCFVSSTEKKSRTVKLQKPIVKYPATPEHPAQTEMVTEDEIVGYWATVNFSGAIPELDKEKMMDRVTNLLESVKVAREEANSIEVTLEKTLGEAVLNYIFEN